MATLKLTKTIVESLEPSPQEQVVWDESLPGFGLRIKPTGVRSYIVQYRNRTGGCTRTRTLDPLIKSQLIFGDWRRASFSGPLPSPAQCRRERVRHLRLVRGG